MSKTQKKIMAVKEPLYVMKDTQIFYKIFAPIFSAYMHLYTYTFLKPFKTLAIRALSDIKRLAPGHVSYLIKHYCSCFEYDMNYWNLVI